MWATRKDGLLSTVAVAVEIDGARIHAGELRLEGGRFRQGLFRYSPDYLAAASGRTGPTAPRPLLLHGLPLGTRSVSQGDSELPLALHDATPDGWGKAILSLAYPTTPMRDPEYMAAAGPDRVGNILTGPAPGIVDRWVPEEPAFDLPTGEDGLEDLLAAADAVENELPTRSHLARLLRSASDLGGARPKARFRIDGVDWIAKFPARDDAFDHQRVEAACLSTAAAAGIETPEHRILEVGGRSVLLVRRFDRMGGRRLGYTSAATLLEHPPGTYRSESASYAEIAVRAQRAGAAPCGPALFDRMLLNCFLNNTDDHLRNHAFIDDGGWRLSPVFDLVPQRGRVLYLRPVRGEPPVGDPREAFLHHAAFGLGRAEAEARFLRVADAVAGFSEQLAAHRASDRDREVLARLMPHLDVRTPPVD